MTWIINVDSKSGVYATVDGFQLNDDTVSVYEGKAALLEIWKPKEYQGHEETRKLTEDICIYKKILIGSGTEPEK